jgi:hypothetical protein
VQRQFGDARGGRGDPAQRLQESRIREAPASPAATRPAAVTEISTHIRVDRVSSTPLVFMPTSTVLPSAAGRADSTR